jgi:hypothetical protein
MVADLMGYSLVGLPEAYVPQQILHPERVCFIQLEEQPDLVEVVLGTVGGTVTCYSCIEEPIGVLSEQRIHGA